MIRLKIIKAHKKYNVDDIVYVSPNEAHGLIDAGYAKQTKDFTPTDYRIKEDGRTIKLRINRSSKR